jgi:DNA-directed RNA polymerase subunit K/omega
MNSDEELTLETEDVVINTEKDMTDPNEINEDETEHFNIETIPNIDIVQTITDPSKRTSKNKLTRYEFVRLIGEREMQLRGGAKPLILQDKKSEQLSFNEIAIEELKNNMIPFKIRRPVKDHYEIWKIDELDKKHLEYLFN